MGSVIFPCRRDIVRLAALLLLVTSHAIAQTEPEQVGQVLAEPIVSPEVSVFRLKQYLLGRVAPQPSATSKDQWAAAENRLRRHLLDEYNIEIGAGLGPLTGKIWRVGLMGASSSPRLVLLLLEALKSALSPARAGPYVRA